MPELPEVEALAGFLRERAAGRFLARVDVAAISVLKTYDPPPSALHGLPVQGAGRTGKFLDLQVGGLHLVMHLARAGWLAWRTQLPPAPPRPGKAPLALRVHLDDGSGFDVTEAGTRKRLSVYVVRELVDVPGIARLGPDPLAADFTVDRLAAILQDQGRAQLKGVLTDQQAIAGIGNAYSDEILHAARLSPFAPAGGLDVAAAGRLHEAIGEVLAAALERSRGRPPAELKDDKRAGLVVHNRTGLPCPVCGDTVREVAFADSSLQYCPTCQTRGKPLADRRLSRLVR